MISSFTNKKELRFVITLIRKVCRGWMVFDFATDYEIWKGQK